MGIEKWNGKAVEMNENKIIRMSSGSDECASSQRSHGAKEAKDLALGFAKMPRD